MIVDFGPNLTSVLIAFVAIVPAILAAYYARKAVQAADVTAERVDGMIEKLDAAKADARAEGAGLAVDAIAAAPPVDPGDVPPG